MSSTSTRGRLLREAPTAGARTPKSILARLDRIDVWSMPFMFVGIIGLGYMFAFYDVFDIRSRSHEHTELAPNGQLFSTVQMLPPVTN